MAVLKQDIIDLAKTFAKLGDENKDLPKFDIRFSNAYPLAESQLIKELGNIEYVRYHNLSNFTTNPINNNDYVELVIVSTSFEVNDIVTLTGTSYNGIYLVKEVLTDSIILDTPFIDTSEVVVIQKDVETLNNAYACILVSKVTFTAQEIKDGTVLDISTQFGEGDHIKDAYSIVRNYRSDFLEMAREYITLTGDKTSTVVGII